MEIMKRVVLAMLLLTMLIGLLGCSGNKAGISYVNDQPVYTVRMTSSERESYFEIGSKAGTVAAAWYGKNGINAISWYSVEGGGWIAWVGNTVRYVPAGFDGELSTAFASLSTESSAMSIEDAKAYIPQLAD